MLGEDFMAVVNSSPGTASALRNMCRKRLFKKAVKQFSLMKNRGLSDDDIVAAFHDADVDKVRCRLCLPRKPKQYDAHTWPNTLRTSFFSLDL